MTTSADNTIVFYYFPAFFGGFDPDKDADREPRIKIWIEHPAAFNYDLVRAFPVDLSKTPSRTDDWDRVALDDHANSPTFGYTTLGPLFPHAYSSAGVYLSLKTVTQLGVFSILKNRAHVVEGDGPSSDPSPTGVVGQQSNEGREKSDSKTDRVKLDETAIVKRTRSHDGSTYAIRRYHGFFGLKLPVIDESPATDNEPKPPGAKDEVPRPANQFRIVYQPGTAQQDSSRAPRKLLISESNIFDPSRDTEFGTLTHNINLVSGTPGLYLDQDYALYVAELDVPKRPSGSGEALVVRQKPEVHFPSPPNLNVMSASPSGELVNISGKLKQNCLLVEDHETLADALTKYHATKWQEGNKRLLFNSLDIIGHSRSGDAILKLGEQALTPRVVEAEFARLSDQGILEDLGINRVRLLGCRTGTHPRGRRAVSLIREYLPRAQVYAARADLFAVHYNHEGLLPEAEVLLADDDVVTTAGPGDVPPGDDYPTVSRDIADDTEDYSQDIGAPSSFSVVTLSDANAAIVSAYYYLFWKKYNENFDKLVAELHSNSPIRDNSLLRADYEVIVSTSVIPAATSDFRTFDLILPKDNAKPRIRVHTENGSYAFLFKRSNSQEIMDYLSRELEFEFDAAVQPED